MAITARRLAVRMQRRASLVQSEFRKTSNGLGIAAVGFDKMLMTSEIYAIPETVSPRTGKKLWRRTGQLRRAERFVLKDAYTVRVLNDQRYAKPRHEAGKPGHRAIDPLRESHWRDELAKVFRPICRDAWRATVQALLKKGSI